MTCKRSQVSMLHIYCVSTCSACSLQQLTCHLAGWPAGACAAHQGVAGHHWPPEPAALNAAKEEQPLAGLIVGVQHHDTGQLGHGLNLQHACRAAEHTQLQARCMLVMGDACRRCMRRHAGQQAQASCTLTW
jgi:hypothetical protein